MPVCSRRTVRPLFVLLGERVSGSHLDHVTIANEASGREAAEHLLAAGRRSLIFIGAHEGRQFGTGWLRALRIPFSA